MSWPQIEREIARGGLPDGEKKELWDCLWLDREEVREFLEHVRQVGGPPYLYRMVSFAAYTGLDGRTLPKPDRRLAVRGQDRQTSSEETG